MSQKTKTVDTFKNQKEEVNSSFFYFKATDADGLQDTEQIVIKIIDVNDNKPVCDFSNKASSLSSQKDDIKFIDLALVCTDKDYSRDNRVKNITLLQNAACRNGRL